jgi:very-short-patch-repair endonuclease
MAKSKAFYKKPDFVTLLDTIKKELAVIEGKADSKAEQILLGLLASEKIPCVFHRQIGPYTADYLINDHIVIELDGPHHQNETQGQRDDKKDKYLKRMGYVVLRIPLWVLEINTDAVLSEIKQASELILQPKKKARKP